jgi:hypothetical protein
LHHEPGETQLATREVTAVERDDRDAARGDRKLEHVVVGLIAQIGPPSIVNLHVRHPLAALMHGIWYGKLGKQIRLRIRISKDALKRYVASQRR